MCIRDRDKTSPGTAWHCQRRDVYASDHEYLIPAVDPGQYLSLIHIYRLNPGFISHDRLVKMPRKSLVCKRCKIGNICSVRCFININRVMRIIVNRCNHIKCRGKIICHAVVNVIDGVTCFRRSRKIIQHNFF